MNKPWRLALFGVAAFVLFLVLTAPASKLLPLLQPQLPGVQFSGISGSLWSGRAQLVQAGGVPLNDVRWHWRPLALFTGALEVGVEAQLSRQPLHAHAGLGLFSGAYAADVTGSMAASDLLFLSGMHLAELSGQVDFDLDRVTGLGGGMPAVAGVVSWTPARVLAPLQLDLGKAQLETQIDAGVTHGRLVASGGVLGVNGDVTLNPDGSYSLVGDVSKQGGVPQAVDKFLDTFAEPVAGGGYRLQWSDRIQF